MTDPDADPAALRVVFTPEGGAGQRVPVTPALSGSFRIPSQRAGGTVTVSVADAAGNVGSATCRTGGGASPVSYSQSVSQASQSAGRGALPAPVHNAGLSTEPRPSAPSLPAPSLPSPTVAP
ncbi:hypothetical protein ACG2DA_23110, partial [Alienimonas sp. DA493]